MKLIFWKSRTFRKWFACYLIIVLLPMGFCIFVYEYTQNSLSEKVMESGQAAVQQMRSVMDERLSQVYYVSNTISSSSDIRKLRTMTLPYTSDKYYEIHQRIKVLERFNVQDDLISSLYIYTGSLESLLDAGHIYTKLNQLDYIIEEKLGLTAERFEQIVGANHFHEFDIIDRNTLLYLRTIVEGKERGQTPPLTLMIFIQTKPWLQLLAQTSNNMSGSAYILMPNNRAFGNFTEGDPMDYEALSEPTGIKRLRALGRVVVYADSQVSAYRYVLSVPVDTFMKDIRQMNVLFISCLTIVILLSGFMAYALATRCYRPLHRLKQNADIADHAKDDFEVLNTKLTALRESEKQIQQEYTQLRAIADDRLFHLLLSGDLISITPQQREQLPRLFSGSVFVAALVEIRQSPALGDNSAMIDVMLNKLLDLPCKGRCEYLSRRDGDDFAIIFCFEKSIDPTEAQLTVQTIAATLQERLPQVLKVDASVYVGDAQEGLRNICISAANARRAREYADFVAPDDHRTVLFDRSMYSTSIQWSEFDIVDAERRFVNLMTEGDYQGGRNVLHDIFSYYNCRDGVSLYVMRCRMFGVMNLVLNVLHEIEPDIDNRYFEDTDMVSVILSARTMDELKGVVFGIISRLVGRDGSQQADIYDKIKKVETYVAANYADENLGVQSIADAFGISLPYLSRMFKKEKGVGLLDYINRHRILKARVLLSENPQMTIAEVAKTVGYTSSQTFIRIFKRYEGVTPGSLRTENGRDA